MSTLVKTVTLEEYNSNGASWSTTADIYKNDDTAHKTVVIVERTILGKYNSIAFDADDIIKLAEELNKVK